MFLILARFLEHNIKTHDGRIQRQELNHKEYKLQCTVLGAEGMCIVARLGILQAKSA